MMNFSEKEYRLIKSNFLDKNIFCGLTNMNNGFDVLTIKYFSEPDFEIILDRVKEFKLGIFGIEPWLNGNMYDMLSSDDYGLDSKDSNWYKDAFQKFISTKLPLVYAATYDIPKSVLNNFNQNEFIR